MKSGWPVTARAIQRARKAANLTQQASADLLECSVKNWHNWEQGRYAMPLAIFDMYLLKTGQYEEEPAGNARLRLKLKSGRTVVIP